jgi:hypothetical protein
METMAPTSSIESAASSSAALMTTTTTATTALSSEQDNYFVAYNLVESRQYKAALVLNNIGVALLEVSAYQDAANTFKNAFDIVRNLTPQKINDGTKETSHSPTMMVQINHDLKLANQTLLQYHSSKNELGDKASSKLKTFRTFFDLTVLSDDDYDAIFEAAHSYPMNNSGYAIRIDSTCDYYTCNFLLQSSIIVMNYGISSRCLINLSQKDKCRARKEPRYVKQTYKLFKVAYGLLTCEANNLLRERNDDDSSCTSFTSDDDMGVLEERVELMKILAVQGLMHMSFDLCLPEEGQKFYSILGDLHVRQKKRKSPTPVCLRSIAPAA